jgi:low affinity Fe/Cu permease
VKHLVVYSAVRLGIFLAALAILLIIGFDWVLGAVFATGIALALSVIFLGGMRQRAAASIQNRVTKPVVDADTAHEDAQIAAQSADD